jgi:hypothetical protein
VLLTLFRAFFDICRLRKGPQDVPASPELLSLSLLAYLAAVAMLTMLSRPPAAALGASAIETALVAGINFVLLALRRFEGRWMQTTTAMAGTGVLFTLFALPLFAGLSAAGSGAGAVPGVLYASLLLLVVWNIAVTGHILKHALALPFPVAILIAAAYAWVVAMAISGLFPEPA